MAFADDYITVAERIVAFVAKYPDGSLQTDIIEMTPERVTVRAMAYRTPDDPRPGIGHSWLAIPGRTNFTRGSELENAESSAWGRAIAALGFEVRKGIATAEEVRNKAGESRTEPARTAAEVKDEHSDEPFPAILSGKVTYGKAPVDGEFRNTPEGHSWGFALQAEGDKRVQVLALPPLGEALFNLGGNLQVELAGKQVTVHGIVHRVPWKTRDGKELTFQRLILERIETPEWTLPAPAPVSEDDAEIARLADQLWDERQPEVEA